MSSEIFERCAACVIGAQDVCRVCPVTGQGARAVCDDGSTLLDFACGGVVGWGDKDVAAAISEQAKKLTGASICATESAAEYASRLLFMTSSDSLIFSHDRKSAIGSAVRLAHAYSKARYGEGRDGVLYAGDDVSMLMASVGSACALVFEPIDIENSSAQSEEKLCELFTFAAENDLLTIADETYLGLFRSGAVTACAKYELYPDLLLLSGGIAGGLPMAVCLVRGEASRVSIEADAGDPITCAAAKCVLDKACAIAKSGSIAALSDKLDAELKRCANIHDVRTLGLTASFCVDGNAAVFRRKLASAGLLTAQKNDRILLLPPLCVTEKEIEEAAAILG